MHVGEGVLAFRVRETRGFLLLERRLNEPASLPCERGVNEAHSKFESNLAFFSRAGRFMLYKTALYRKGAACGLRGSGPLRSFLPCMPNSAPTGLSLTTELYEEVNAASESGSTLDLTSFKKKLKTLNRLFSEQKQELTQTKRTMHFEKLRFTAELDSLRAEVHAELVDREANAARVAERQRFLFERSVALPGQLSAADRAGASAAFVEAALVALCPQTTPLSHGCETLSSLG